MALRIALRYRARMILATALALLPTPDPAHVLLDRLAGCWDAPGEVMGRPATTRVRGTWRLGGRYLLLESHGMNPAEPHDAAIIIGDHDKTRLRSWWMDSFGAGNSAAGHGQVEADAIAIDYAYPEAVYASRLAPDGKGWRWTITERKPDGSKKLFAAFRLSPVACGDTQFAF